MADSTLSGLGDETLKNAHSINIENKEIRDTLKAQKGDLKDIDSAFSAIRTSVDKVAKIQDEALKGSKGMADALKEQNKQYTVVRNLNEEINALHKEAGVAGGDAAIKLRVQAVTLEKVKDNAKKLADIYGTIAQSASKLNGQTKFFTALSDTAKKIPILNKFATPFEKAAEAARKTALDNAKINEAEPATIFKSANGKYRTASGRFSNKAAYDADQARIAQESAPSDKKSILGAGAKAGLSDMLGSVTSMLSMVSLATTTIGFIVDLFVGANKNIVAISKNLGITQVSANAIRLHFIDIAAKSSNILVNSTALIEAQKALVDNLGYYTKIQDSTLLNQVFLTKNLGLSVDAASDLGLIFEAQGQNAEKVTSNMNDANNAAAKASGSMIPFSKLMAAVAKTSFEIKGYFGFNNQAIAEGVRQVAKYGLELENAKSVSKSLLDFESSIGNQLTLQLLTGKEFNFEKARAKALTGDLAGATSDVMKQMQSLTEEQRKNPLIMEAAASATGLTVDQLDRAYLVSKKLSNAQKNYVDDLQRQGKIKDANQATDMAIAGQSIDQIQKTITVQDAFNAALEKLKDQLTKIAGTGALEKLTNVIIAFVTTVTGPKGFSGLFSLTGTSEFTKNLGSQNAKDAHEALVASMVPKNANKAQQITAEKLARATETVEYVGQEGSSDWLQHRNKIIRDSKTQASEVSNGLSVINAKGNLENPPMNKESAEYWSKMLDFQSKILEATSATKTTNFHLGADTLSSIWGYQVHPLGAQ